jgi:hypothetical protein
LATLFCTFYPLDLIWNSATYIVRSTSGGGGATRPRMWRTSPSYMERTLVVAPLDIQDGPSNIDKQRGVTVGTIFMGGERVENYRSKA